MRNIMELQTLIELVEHSVKKNGNDKPLTLGHFLNLLKLADKKIQQEEDNDYGTYDPYWD